MTFNSSKLAVEVEAKFFGCEPEFKSIVGWLEKEGFSGSKKPAVHRIHVYFDDDAKLRNAGCRLRCVIASGEWCRYDFKADDPSGRGETTEVSIEHSTPIPLAVVIEDILGRLPDGPPRNRLEEVRDSALLVLAMMGTHWKTVAVRENLELEVSWDVLIPLDSGTPISEVEVELLSGQRRDFDSVISRMATELRLEHVTVSKYERALVLTGRVHGKIGAFGSPT